MSSTRPAQFLLRHLANLLAPGLVFLPGFVAFIQYQGYPLWRSEVLVVGLILLGGLPFGLLLSWRPRTFGAAAVVLLLLILAMQVLSQGVVESLDFWGDLNQELAVWDGPVGGLALGVLIALPIVAVPFALLSRLGPNLGLILTTVFCLALLSGLTQSGYGG